MSSIGVLAEAAEIDVDIMNQIFEENHHHCPRLQGLPVAEARARFDEMIANPTESTELLLRYLPRFDAHDCPEAKRPLLFRDRVRNGVSIAAGLLLFVLSAAACSEAAECTTTYLGSGATGAGSLGMIVGYFRYA